MFKHVTEVCVEKKYFVINLSKFFRLLCLNITSNVFRNFLKAKFVFLFLFTFDLNFLAPEYVAPNHRENKDLYLQPISGNQKPFEIPEYIELELEDSNVSFYQASKGD